MSQRSGLFSDISWFQVAASALASVTAAWIASSLGVAGTLIGAALGSLVVTISTAFYGRTLDKGKTLIVQTASGALIEKDDVQEGGITQAFADVAEDEDSTVTGAEVVDGPPRRLRWKTIVATTVIVLAIAIAVIAAYELVTDKSFGADPDNPRIVNPLGGSNSSDDDDPTPKPAPTKSASTPAPDPTRSTAPAPTASTPAPTATTPEASATPTPTPTAAPTPRLDEPAE